MYCMSADFFVTLQCSFIFFIGMVVLLFAVQASSPSIKKPQLKYMSQGFSRRTLLWTHAGVANLRTPRAVSYLPLSSLYVYSSVAPYFYSRRGTTTCYLFGVRGWADNLPNLWFIYIFIRRLSLLVTRLEDVNLPFSSTHLAESIAILLMCFSAVIKPMLLTKSKGL